MNHADCLPDLIKYGDIVSEYLAKHLSEDQITTYLNYFNSPTRTYGDTLRHITVNDGHTDIVFYALESLWRIAALCDAAENPSDEPLDSRKAFYAVFSALRAGMVIGAVADDKGKEAIFALAKHGQKFAKSVGKKPGKLSNLLESMHKKHFSEHQEFPDYKRVIWLLKKEIGKGVVHSVDEIEGVEWGHSGSIGCQALKNKLSDIKKKIRAAMK